MPTNYIAEKSASLFIKNDVKRTAIQNYIQKAKQLDDQYIALQARQKELLFAQQLNLEHQKKMQIAVQNNQNNPYVNSTYWDFQKNKNDNNNLQMIQQWLNELHHWSLQGYQVVMGMRKTVTGQEFVYHIQDESGSYHYTLNENQYLRLLASNQLSMSYATVNQLEEAAKGGIPLADLFKLQVNATQKNLSSVDKWSQQKGRGEILKAGLKNDALYQFLYEEDNIIRDENGRVLHSRIYELYSQLSSTYRWVRNPDGSIKGTNDKKNTFFSKTRANAVRSFISKYKEANLHKDNTAFYKTGDAIQDNYTLIENKVGKAVVSVSTIRRAIKDIAALGGVKSVAELKKELINLFTYSGKDAFSRKIQEGAKNVAVKAIKELFTKS